MFLLNFSLPVPQRQHRLHPSRHMGHRKWEVCGHVHHSDQQPAVDVYSQPSGISEETQTCRFVSVRHFDLLAALPFPTLSAEAFQCK